MRIKNKIRQSRRDFTAVYQCEHCGAERASGGYDDAHFHQNVIPTMKCHECGEVAPSNAPKTTPDVPAHVIILSLIHI